MPSWTEGPLPSWTAPLLWSEGQPVRGVRYLLTFRPFGALPDPVRRAYLAGRLHLLPCPASLLFWGAPLGLRLQGELTLAMQVPLLNRIERHDGPRGLRVPQSGWLHEPGPGSPDPGEHADHVKNTYRRTHRMIRTHRDEADASEADAREDRMAHVLFDDSEAIGLYGKPMARNSQIWTEDFRLLLDGPNAGRAQIEAAAGALKRGGLFGYRFQFPAMRVGRNEIYWHRPLAAFLAEASERVTVVFDGPTGYLIAYDADRPRPEEALELWPRLLDREPHKATGSLFDRVRDPRDRETAQNCRKLLDARDLLDGRPLPRSFARRLLKAPRHQTLEGWLDGLPGRADEPERAQRLAEVLRAGIETGSTPPAQSESITFARTARRTFEVAYWKTIARLTDGRFANRNNADCALDDATRAARRGHDHRDLESLGDHLLARHARAIDEAGMGGKAVAGDLPFRWRTDFEFRWSGGWRASQNAGPGERDLIVIIPGRDRGRAVIMADHYDTAYMEDLYKSRRGGESQGPRLATPGADDNTSATATLLQAALIFLELSREGRLMFDIWLIHLTGEEFPADCLGARHLSQQLVQGTLAARLPDGKHLDLSGVRVEGIYLMDMIAHEQPRRPGVFQIAPGSSRESMALALEAHRANEAWNAEISLWNRRPARRARKAPRGDGSSLPRTARHPEMIGEIRPHEDSRSTLYNSDGQVFSDAGIPVVLFMEDYDINRSGYHDSKDTMAGIDLDYGSALAAIAIESVARVSVHGFPGPHVSPPAGASSALEQP